MKFCPSPPNSIFTIRTANTLPSAAIHRGTVAGRVYAKSTPVTAALQSPTVTGSFMSFSYKNSVKTHTAAQSAMTASARHPKLHTPNTPAGSRESSTQRMSVFVSVGAWICGDSET